jgi:hypothetical protein
MGFQTLGPNCGLFRLFPDGILILRHVHANPSCLLQSKSNLNLETRNIAVSQKGKELGMYMIRSPSKRRRVPPRRLQRTIQPDIILSRATAERRRPPGVPIRWKAPSHSAAVADQRNSDSTRSAKIGSRIWRRGCQRSSETWSRSSTAGSSKNVPLLLTSVDRRRVEDVGLWERARSRAHPHHRQGREKEFG